jgi:8-oxo-dGTP pyrophosphatase MutT (NUDIX family)
VPIPEFVVELRRLVGRREMWLPGVTAVVRRPVAAGDGEEILLVQRADNSAWTPVTGISEPREEPAAAATREVLEETGVTIRVDRLAATSVHGPVTHSNGDLATYLDLTFACTWLEGEAHVADDESRDVAWVRRDSLPEMSPEMLARIDAATSDEREARFLRQPAPPKGGGVGRRRG